MVLKWVSTHISDAIKGNRKIIRALLLAAILSLSVVPAYAQYYATYYNCCNSHTASGEPFDPNGMTAAHKTLPFGTKVRVTYQGHSIVVTINDRGPYNPDKNVVIDLTEGAARALGCKGKCPITLQVLG